MTDPYKKRNIRFTVITPFGEKSIFSVKDRKEKGLLIGYKIHPYESEDQSTIFNVSVLKVIC